MRYIAAILVWSAVVGACSAPDTIEPSTSTAAPTTSVASTSTTTTAPPATTVVTLAPTTTTTWPDVDPRPKGSLVIHGVGDVALDPNYVVTFRTEGYGYAWSGLEGLFQQDDLTVINMECAVSELGSPVPKAFNFRCDPESLGPAKEAGIDVANLANNHGLDYGREALLDSIINLEAAGIWAVGAGANYDEAYEPAVLEINGWTVAVLGFGGVLNTRSWLATDERAGIASGDDTEDMVAAVERASDIADLVVVTVHWGFELDTQPRADDIARAEAMVAAGADIIFGHHQHRLNPLGWVDGKPVAWGLGNFIWPRISVASATTAIARVVVHPDGQIGACLIAAEIVRHGHPEFTGERPGYCPPVYDGEPWSGTDTSDAD